MKKNALIATVLSAVAVSFGFTTALAEEATTAGTQVLCPSLHEYEIDPATAGSTYNWGIDDGTSGTDWTLSSTTGTTVNVDWINPGSYNFWSQETNEHGCQGPKTIIAVTVSPTPEVADAENNVCSTDQATGSAVDVVTLELPQASNPGAAVSKWDITNIAIPTGVTAGAGNATTGATTDANAIKNDTYKNTTDATADVVYTITPYAGDCPGTPFTITIHVYPEVKAPTIKF